MLKKTCISFIFFYLILTFESFTQSCTNWLKLNSQPSFVRVGDLDVSGDKITVEAVFNRTASWNGADVWQGDLVSKHENQNDCNYLLRPGSAEITTTKGYFKTPSICPIELNRTYHAAMVYDGTTLKFYRNGVLMSQIAASGNLFQNNWEAQIGLYFNQITQENFIGYINEVRIWSIVRTETEIKDFMDKSLPDPQNVNGLLAYYTFDNLLNKQGNQAWNGKLFGNASINSTNPVCNLITGLPSFPIDFGFKQSLCNPKAFEFSTTLNGVQSFEWQFGNGQKNNSTVSPTIAFDDFGLYDVKLIVRKVNGCVDSISKTVTVAAVFDESIITNNDTTICLGDSVLVKTVDLKTNYCWSNTSGTFSMPHTNYIKPSANTTYFITTQIQGNNLVINSDFSAGNSGFTSDYFYTTNNNTEKQYWVGSKPSSWNTALNNCGDHTTETGNMLCVNGSPEPNAKVWSQVVNVTPNTTYNFSVWIASLYPPNPANLKFSINDVIIGNNILASSPCQWNQFYSTWNSGTSTTATITIVNNNTIVQGNDFALDDIFFGPVSTKTDSFRINISSIPDFKIGNDTTICKGESIQLSSNFLGTENISWYPALYLNQTNIHQPLAKPSNNVKYFAEVINNIGCKKTDSINISVIEKPVIDLRPVDSICFGSSVNLNANIVNASNTTWIPASGLSNSAINNPAASPLTNTEYSVTVNNNGYCFDTKRINILVKPLPVIVITNDSLICEGAKVQLNASGGVKYLWTPSNGLSSLNSSNPIASPNVSTKYKVDVTGDNGCYNQDSVLIEVKPKPIFSLTPQIQSICLGETVTLKAQGGDIYEWKDLTSTSSNIIIKPLVDTNYTVYIKSLSCDIVDTLKATISVKQLPEISILKSNDIDCSNFQSQLVASGGASYEWYPSATLSNPFSNFTYAAPKQTTTYKLKVGDGAGCYAEDSIVVNVNALSGVAGNHIPSAFTPNNDGKNDCFSLKHWGNVENFSINIYNRWGEVVFSSDNNTNCWDGTFKGLKQPSGTFVYYVKGKTICGDVVKKGLITLIR